MKLDEFTIIQNYFYNKQTSLTQSRSDILLGSGDDCALLTIPSEQSLAVSMDTLISGVHFPTDCSPDNIARQALSVNLSDLAAMGAEPAWFTCSLTLPNHNNNPDWLEKFSEGLFDVAHKFKIVLIGGDLVQGDTLSITIQVHGFVPFTLALRRDNAKPGESIYISGKLGQAVLSNYYHVPKPRVKLGLALRGISQCAIDISDGLISDLNHILKKSQVGANIYLDKIPLVHEAGLYAGDDYELCFTAPANLKISGFDIVEIGYITAEKNLRVYKPDGSLYDMTTISQSGYRHF